MCGWRGCSGLSFSSIRHDGSDEGAVRWSMTLQSVSGSGNSIAGRRPGFLLECITVF